MTKISPWAFVLAVPELDKTADYFRDVLGFQVQWAEAAEWRLVERDGVRVMLGSCPKDMRPSELGSHNWFGYLETDDLDALYIEITGRGAACTQPTERHYGMREVVVTTIDGHRIVFGQQVQNSPQGLIEVA